MKTIIFALIGASLAVSAATAAPKVPDYVIDFGKRSTGFSSSLLSYSLVNLLMSNSSDCRTREERSLLPLGYWQAVTQHRSRGQLHQNRQKAASADTRQPEPT